MTKVFFHILLFLALLNNLNAQSYYNWQLSDEEGLPSMEIYYLYQDSRAYVWIATDNGLARYDGHQFEYFRHPQQKGQAVTEIREDHLGQIWYRNFVGQLFFINKNDSILELTTPEELELNAYFTYSIVHKRLYIAAKYLGIYDIDQNKWQLDSLPQQAPKGSGSPSISNFTSIDNRLFFINYLGEIWERELNQNKFRGKSQLMTFAAIGKDSLAFVNTDFSKAYQVKAIHELNKETADQSSSKCLNTNSSEEKRILYLYPGASGILWLGTSRGAYGLLRQKDGSWLQEYHLLEDAQISSILEDREGNLWLGTLDNGVTIFPSLHIKHYNNLGKNRSETAIHCIAIDDKNKLLLGSSHGNIFHFNPESEVLESIYQGKNSNVTAIAFDTKRQQIIFNAYELSILKLKQPQEISYYGAGLGGVHDLHIWQDDFLLMSRKAFINIANLKNSFAQNSISANRLSYDVRSKKLKDYQLYYFNHFSNISTTHFDQKHKNWFWVAARDSLFLLKPSKQIQAIPLSGPMLITDIYQTKTGEIWIATANKGILQIVNQKVKAHYHIKNGFPFNSCSVIIEDQRQLWVGTNKGLVKFNPQTQKAEIYNRLDGLPSEDIRDLNIINGTLWVATLKGLLSFDLNLGSKNKLAPFIQLKQVFLNRELIEFETERSFLYHQNDLKFIFQTSAIKGRDAIQYEYRMLGLDSSWIQLPLSTNFVQFQGLGHGEYKFEVRALNEDLIPSQKVAFFNFSIAAPYWQTWWFRFLGYLLLASIIGSFSWWRYQIYRKKQALELSMNRLRMQSLQAQMNPHFVFNAMSAIQDYWIQEDAKTALIYHAQFAKLMRLIFEYSNKLSIRIEKELEFLELYVSLEKMRFDKNITINFDIEDHLLDEEVELVPLLIQPLIENCFKHGLLHKKGDGQISVVMKNEANYIYSSIRDNGVGREQAAAFTSWKKQEKGKLSSQDIIKERLDILNQSYGKNSQKDCFKITDLQEGTLVEIWIPKID